MNSSVNSISNAAPVGVVNSWKNSGNGVAAHFVIDRDGTINKYVGFLKHKEEFELLPKVSEAIRKINCSEYLAIVVTNQPVIARGEVEIDELEEIHNKMETLLGNEGAYIDAIYYCPHHPQAVIEEYRKSCTCRKPEAGLITKAVSDFSQIGIEIDIKNSLTVGNRRSDLLAGINAGTGKNILIGSDEPDAADIASAHYQSLFDLEQVL